MVIVTVAPASVVRVTELPEIALTVPSFGGIAAVAGAGLASVLEVAHKSHLQR